jgi:hypothetical protein
MFSFIQLPGNVLTVQLVLTGSGGDDPIPLEWQKLFVCSGQIIGSIPSFPE